MLLLARRNLLVHKGRFLLAIAGITCSVVLVLLLMGLYAGWRDNMAAYLRHVHADLWVGQKGAYDLFHTLSLLPTLGEQSLPPLETLSGSIACARASLALERRGQHRAAGAEIAVPQDLGVEAPERPHRRGHVAVLE